MAPVNPTTPALIPFDPNPSRERVRSILAMTLIGLVVFEMVSFIVLGAWRPHDSTKTAALKDLVQLILTPTLTLASAVMGFYYASQQTPPTS